MESERLFSRWPPWRPASEFPRPGVPVLVSLIDDDGRGYVELGERPTDGPWTLVGGEFSLRPEEIAGWMPTPPPMDLSTGLSTKEAPEDEKARGHLT